MLLRTGIVLERSGGALPEMMRPFKFFAGGPIGSGRQYVSWIHRLDWIEIVRWIVQTPVVSGPVNATAPHPVTNRQLSRALGRAMHRPSFVPAPGFAVKLVVGEFADSILTGQRVLPARAQKDGYHFRYPEIEQAFQGDLRGLSAEAFGDPGSTGSDGSLRSGLQVRWSRPVQDRDRRQFFPVNSLTRRTARRQPRTLPSSANAANREPRNSRTAQMKFGPFRKSPPRIADESPPSQLSMTRA